jgi:hypothetical protein
MANNPLSLTAADGSPIVELKVGLVLYVDGPPGPVQARRVYDCYMRRCGQKMVQFCSTFDGLLRDWNATARNHFESVLLLALRQTTHWGYGFSDRKKLDSWLFMFHGFQPHSEAGKASFFRFDFDWQVDLKFLRDFADEVTDAVPCLSGFAGYYLQANPKYSVQAFNQSFAWAHRYWGAEAASLDVTVNHMLNGFKCVNWLTIIGNALQEKDRPAIDQAKSSAHSFSENKNAVILQAEATPRLIDRHLQEPLGGYASVAQALLPLQTPMHAPFGGTMWDEDNTMRYLRRFTHPNEV